MHIALKQIAKCVHACEIIEETISKYFVEIPNTDLAEGEDSCYTFEHVVRRGARSVSWGINFELTPGADKEETYAIAYVCFMDGTNQVLDINYDPINDKWDTQVTKEELKVIEHVNAADQQNLSAELMRDKELFNTAVAMMESEMSTAQAILLIRQFAKWFSDMNASAPG